MKKVINNPENVVREMLEGMTLAYPEQVRNLEDTTVLVRKDAPVAGKVAIVSGGGSGHEPAHAGYIGRGMLDAAVAGEMFTSPTPDQVIEAIRAVDSGQGVFLVIKNYTGDVMNFEMAREMAEAEGISVEQVVVNDDVAVEDSSFTTGRRGIAGTVFVHKIAGAKAAAGGSLKEVKEAAEKVVANTRSMGVALSPCTIPGAGKPNFQLEDDEMEVGIGIHGEPGTKREKIAPADDIAEELLQKVLEDSVDFDKSEVAVMVNGLGATPESELFIVNRYVHSKLREKGINVTHTFVGEYMTSLEMAGFSITLMKVDEEIKQLLDAEAAAPAFHR
ncbi:dihydroxyacetone kinase subunit DhaK [Salimicrobium jeotgali]|uniref:phosphoenolpyruvate--glycerone phosphotransferase n=1 Tax=Salimicrobium jeotgali TaxID=1230341 RepID=K2H5E2_9BACI|nr:dihydroxyacetone kinase subunit DhaK [Salimicrobium jeotgali]AKG05473.1 dihydroxyacetone kinase subunit DhaK [Salimicrobium jeotgali]EKE31060.1 dihydroxyacetone kinase subunit DhaK [Salimicrobium jeotgali]MBM7697383.1 dihydroxyacetone kinase-like protein [Salimicrobium jeotgali]